MNLWFALQPDLLLKMNQIQEFINIAVTLLNIDF